MGREMVGEHFSRPVRPKSLQHESLGPARADERVPESAIGCVGVVWALYVGSHVDPLMCTSPASYETDHIGRRRAVRLITTMFT
jgi:hypothetical protein